MSIVTRHGDLGETGLMYNRRVPKNHSRVEAYGAVDELNAAIGMARATATEKKSRETLEAIQKDLVVLMGELATATDDLARYARDGYSLLRAEHTAKLDKLIGEIEAKKLPIKGWAMPGATIHSAALDMARTVCRRAERRVCDLQSGDQLRNPEIIVFLNRLSDLLWLMARAAEAESAG